MTKPTRFDANLVVIGAGTGGLVSAYLAATMKAKVVLVESDRSTALEPGCPAPFYMAVPVDPVLLGPLLAPP